MKRLDKPLSRLKAAEKDGKILSIIFILVISILVTAVLALVKMIAGVVLAIVLFALLLPMLSFLVDMLEPRRVAYRFRVIPAIRRARLDTVTPAGLLVLCGERITLPPGLNGRDDRKVIGARDRELRGLLEPHVKQLRARIHISADRMDAVRHWQNYGGPLADLLPVLDLHGTERMHLDLSASRIAEELRTTTSNKVDPFGRHLVQEVTLQLVSLEPARRRLLATLYILAVQHCGLQEGKGNLLREGVSLLDDEQLRAAQQLASGWTNSPEQLIELVTTL